MDNYINPLSCGAEIRLIVKWATRCQDLTARERTPVIIYWVGGGDIFTRKKHRIGGLNIICIQKSPKLGWIVVHNWYFNSEWQRIGWNSLQLQRKSPIQWHSTDYNDTLSCPVPGGKGLCGCLGCHADGAGGQLGLPGQSAQQESNLNICY